MLMLVVGSLVVLSAGSAGADPIRVERPTRVVVAPTSFQAYGSLDEPLSEQHSEAFRTGVRRYLANHDETYRLVSRGELREQVTSQPVYEETHRVAEDWAKLGTESYKNLRTDEAIRQLENAVEKYRSIDHRLVEPKRVAEVLMYLSLSYLNQGENAARPLTLMEQMIRLDPQRLFRRGFYPDKIANFFASARQDKLRAMQTNGPSEERAKGLAEMMDAEIVAFGSAVPRGDGGYEARLFLYSRPDEAFVETEGLAVESREPAAFRAASNRLVGRMTPCLQPPRDDEQVDTIVESRGDGPLSMQLGFAYGTFLRFPEPPIAKPFGNIGVSTDIHLALTEEFSIRGGVDILHSLRDYSGRIMDPLYTVRGHLGPDLGANVGRFNFGLSVGLEGTHVSPFVLCRNLDVPAQATSCPNAQDRERFDLPFLVGVNVHPRVRFHLFDSFELVAGGGYTFFFVPFSNPPLNNPIVGEAGIQYRF